MLSTYSRPAGEQWPDGSSITGSGNNLTINLALSFTGSFAGQKSIYALANDNGGLTSNWQTLGTWMVP